MVSTAQYLLDNWELFFIAIFHRAAGVIFLNLRSDHVKSLSKICW